MSLEPEELEFLAGHEDINIIPTFECDTMWLLSGDLGPLKIGIPSKVPLWAALHLRKLNKCRVIPPVWMSKAFLQKAKEDEARSPLFTKMPSEQFMTISKMLCEACPEDILDCDAVKTLIKELWDTRQSKLRAAVLTFLDTGARWAKVDNLTQVEISSIRPYFTHSLEQLHRLQSTATAARLYSAGNSSKEVRQELRM